VSTRKVDDLVRALGLEGCSRSEVSRICRELDEAMERFRRRPLEGEYPYVWLDAKAVRSFRQEVWNFASGGDLLGSLDPVHVPDARVDLREQVRGVQAAETPFRHQEHLPDHRGGPV
jgi:hypothetical protein